MFSILFAVMILLISLSSAVWCHCKSTQRHWLHFRNHLSWKYLDRSLKKEWVFFVRSVPVCSFFSWPFVFWLGVPFPMPSLSQALKYNNNDADPMLCANGVSIATQFTNWFICPTSSQGLLIFHSLLLHCCFF